MAGGNGICHTIFTLLRPSTHCKVCFSVLVGGFHANTMHKKIRASFLVGFFLGTTRNEVVSFRISQKRETTFVVSTISAVVWNRPLLHSNHVFTAKLAILVRLFG